MLVIADIYKLLALHRFIAETKFVASMDNPAGHGTGYIAEIAKENLKAIIEYYEQNEMQEEADGWREWMVLSKKSVAYSRIVEKIKSSNRLHSMDIETRAKAIKELAAPYEISEALLADLQKEIEN